MLNEFFHLVNSFEAKNETFSEFCENNCRHKEENNTQKVHNCESQ